VLGVIAAALAFIVLQFCISVLLNATDAVFIWWGHSTQIPRRAWVCLAVRAEHSWVTWH